MNRNQIKVIIILFVIILVLFFIFMTTKKGEDKIDKNKLTNKTTEILTPTVDLSDQNGDFSRRVASNERLKQIKQNLIGGINYEGIIIDYRQKIDTVIVFYQKSKEEAIKKTNDFFKKQGINEIKKLKIEYISLEKDTNEPPAGYLR